MPFWNSVKKVDPTITDLNTCKSNPCYAFLYRTTTHRRFIEYNECYVLSDAWAAARRAIGTRNGEQLT
jgi:hypothetical protein